MLLLKSKGNFFLKSSNLSKILVKNRCFSKKVRTLKMNRVISLICSNDKALKEWKKRKHTEFGVPSLGVETTEIFSNSFFEDLNVLVDLKRYLVK